MDGTNFPWGFVIVAGPVLLAGVLAWGAWRSASANRKADPNTPGDDPSKGMTGHD